MQLKIISAQTPSNATECDRQGCHKAHQHYLILAGGAVALCTEHYREALDECLAPIQHLAKRLAVE